MNHHTFSIRGRVIRILVLAVLVACVLGGTATAAKLITGKHIKNGSLTGQDLRDGTLTSTDVADGTLTRADVGALEPGLPGPDGQQGPPGPAGPAGADGARDVEYVVVDFGVAASPASAAGTATCSPGNWALGGGASTSAPTRTRMVQSAPANLGKAWRVQLRNLGSSAITGYVWAVCADD